MIAHPQFVSGSGEGQKPYYNKSKGAEADLQSSQKVPGSYPSQHLICGFPAWVLLSLIEMTLRVRTHTCSS